MSEVLISFTLHVPGVWQNEKVSRFFNILYFGFICLFFNLLFLPFIDDWESGIDWSKKVVPSIVNLATPFAIGLN